MSVGRTHGPPRSSDVSVGIFYGIERFLDEFVKVVDILVPAVAQSDIDDEERLRTKVFAQQQHFVEAEAVRTSVAPVHIPVARALFYGA